jgi:hypothetical protein
VRQFRNSKFEIRIEATAVLVVAFAILAAPFAARAQQLDRVWRIGLLLPHTETDSQPRARVTVFRAALCAAKPAG